MVAADLRGMNWGFIHKLGWQLLDRHALKKYARAAKAGDLRVDTLHRLPAVHCVATAEAF